MVITLDEALRIMASGKPFDITFVKADISRKTGGQIRHEQQAVQIGLDFANHVRRLRLRSGRIRNVNIRLITEINNRKVVY
jgi:hypothetical protein